MADGYQPYDLDRISKLCQRLGLAYTFVDSDLLEVLFTDDLVIYFANNPQSHEVEAGIRNSQWRYNEGVFALEIEEGQYAYFDEYELLKHLVTGHILLVKQLNDEAVVDRWLAHKQRPLDLRFIKAGEELRISSLAKHAGRGD